MTPLGVSPSKGTPRRTIRMSDEDWERLRWIAERRGVSISDVIRSGVEREYRAERRDHGRRPT